MDPAEWEKASCWRQWDSNPFCNGPAQEKQYILSIPAILIIEAGESLGCSWNVPPTLLPLGRKFGGPGKGVKYNIAAHIYTNHTVERGSGSHFIARYVTPDGGRIFDYDGMAHEGHAQRQRGAKLSKWLSGPSDKLNNVPTGYSLISVIYHLEGGENAQQIFRTERQKTAPWGLQLDADAASNQPFARFAQMMQPHLIQMTDKERDDWTSKRRRSEAHEYQRDPDEPVTAQRKDNVTDTKRITNEVISLDDHSDGVQPTSGKADADNDSVDALILETIAESPVTQTKPRRLSGATFASSNSSDSTTPCPINCYGCGEISDGDEDRKQVQCSQCKFWSHFTCQPENDEVDWNDPAVHFSCQGCRPRTAAQPCVLASALGICINTLYQIFVQRTEK